MIVLWISVTLSFAGDAVTGRAAFTVENSTPMAIYTRLLEGDTGSDPTFEGVAALIGTIVADGILVGIELSIAGSGLQFTDMEVPYTMA